MKNTLNKKVIGMGQPRSAADVLKSAGEGSLLIYIHFAQSEDDTYNKCLKEFSNRITSTQGSEWIKISDTSCSPGTPTFTAYDKSLDECLQIC